MVMDVKGIVLNFLCDVNRLWLLKGRNKKGDMELEEIVKIVFILIALVVIVGGVVMLLLGKGGRVMDSIKDVFRFGR
jgi:hypothetical protein